MGDAVALSVSSVRNVLKKAETSTLAVTIEMIATGRPVEVERPSLRVAFALDASGSMQGPPLEHALRSVEAMLGILGPKDSVGLIVFSDDASEVAEMMAIADARRVLRSRLARVAASGYTNIEAALVRATKMLGDREANARNVVLLLSDGAPNIGASTPESLAEITRKSRASASFSTLGYGAEHHEDVLAAIADAGGGAYRFVPDPATATVSFGAALGAQGDVVADRVEIVLSPARGVEVRRVLGRRHPRVSSRGMHISMGDLVDGASQLAVALLAVDTNREAGEMALLDCALRFHVASTNEEREVSEPLKITLASEDGPLDAAAYARVLLVECDDVRADARGVGDRGNFSAAASALRKHMEKIAAAPSYVAGSGSALSEAYEQLLDEATAYERQPDEEQYQQFRKAQRGTSVAVSSMFYMSAKAQSAHARGTTDSVAGKFPRAYLEVIAGAPAQRIALGARNVIGRTGHADVVLPVASVSRQHAEVFAHEGRFWLADLGSTNATLLNGERLATRHAPLTNGDTIKVGDIELRYIE